MDNDKLFDDLLKERAKFEKECAPQDITEHMLHIIANLPEKKCNNNLLTKFKSYGFRKFLINTSGVAIIFVIFFIIPMFTENYIKQDKPSNMNVDDSYADDKIKKTIIDVLSKNNIESIKEANNGFSKEYENTFLPGKNNDKIEKILNLVKFTSNIRVANDNELNSLAMKGGGPPYIMITIKGGKSYNIIPAMWIKKVDNGGGEYIWYEDRVILYYYNGDKQTFYTCYSKELVNYLKSISSSNIFNEEKAISMVVKDYSDFPLNKSDINTKELPTGGPAGTTTKVKFMTKAEKTSDATYIVTLIKDWGLSLNDKNVESYWKFKVTPDNVNLIEKVDNDYIPHMVK